MASELTNGQSFIEKAKHIVEANLENEKFDISLLARETGLSKITLYRKIKVATGKTISQFIREIRLNKAKELITNSNKTISEVAYEVGFTSATYFNRCFNKQFACSPGEFRSSFNIQSNEQTRTLKRKPLLIFGIFLPLLLFSLLLYWLNEKPNENDENVSILVRYPKFLENPENEFFAISTNETLINALSSIKSISILDQKIIENYLTEIGDKEKLSNKIKHAYTLEYTIHTENNYRIIFYKLINNDNAEVVLHEIDTIRLKQNLPATKRIVDNIVSVLNISINEESTQSLQQKEQVNPIAEYFYIQAFKILYGNEIKKNRNLYQQAELLLNKALDADSMYYKAYEELAFLYTNKSYWPDIHKETFQDSSFYFANKTLNLNSMSHKAHLMRASYFFHKNKINDALNELDICTSLNPSYLFAYDMKGQIYRYSDLAECIKNYHKALSLSGELLPQMLYSITFQYYNAGCYNEAKHYAQKAFELTNDSSTFYYWLASIEQATGNRETALTYLKKSFRMNPESSNILLALGHYYSEQNDFSESIKYFNSYIDKLKKSDKLDAIGVTHRFAYVLWQIGQEEKANYYFDLQIKNTLKDLELERPFHQYRQIDLAMVYAFRGDKKNAYKYIRTILDQPVCIPSWLNTLIQTDPLLNPLRQDREFKKLAREYQKKYETENQNVKSWIIANNLTLN